MEDNDNNKDDNNDKGISALGLNREQWFFARTSKISVFYKYINCYTSNILVQTSFYPRPADSIGPPVSK